MSEITSCDPLQQIKLGRMPTCLWRSEASSLHSSRVGLAGCPQNRRCNTMMKRVKLKARTLYFKEFHTMVAPPPPSWPRSWGVLTGGDRAPPYNCMCSCSTLNRQVSLRCCEEKAISGANFSVFQT
ncbi:hypothetical protein fugu_018763 [Takifugu bimaculatus]|uniref:Uncharacterized protein n=1 Tax=Takifugu bimaculatus TaxID=433685 RepID=A0A4Z2BM22_9TELE|nr:hypothetical protein fugu_018763 [Takifugu bimaculatus]